MDGSIQGNEQEICPAARQAMELFRQHRPELEEKLRSGAIRYVVEWWEEDSLDIDENAHIFFQFEGDGEYIWDFLTPRQLHDELNDLLQYTVPTRNGRAAVLRNITPAPEKMVGADV